ncbi:MAG TPA: YkvA family protein [Burkholderiales bacterium]|nr:YkvA family protein [Burkholderiales bacterium]
MSLAATLEARARQLKAEVTALYFAARHPRTPWYAKAFIAAIVAYALSPIDLIPDFIPVLGFVDEIVLLPFAIVLAIKLVPADVMAECRARANETGRVKSLAGRIGAVLIVVLWIAAIWWAGSWAYGKLYG